MTIDRRDWDFPNDITYLNHGSFGPSPRVVAEERARWSRQLNANPMDFYLRKFDDALTGAAHGLGQFVGADPRDLVFVDNATLAMNVVAQTIDLKPGDEVLLNDHEYGAVFRIWRAVCERTGARIVCPSLGTATEDRPARFETPADILEPIQQAVTPRTRLIVVSHITSPTAITFPVAEVCRLGRTRQIPVCVDGPHAIALLPLNLRDLDCDFYCASLHKWLSAPFGAGFLAVRRDWQGRVKCPLTSWGRSLGGRGPRWQDSLNWLGTRDPAPFLSVPAAIRFLEQFGLDAFRQQTHELARYCRAQLQRVLGQAATVPDAPEWYTAMTAIPLPPDSARKAQPNSIHPLQQALWDEERIETLVTECHGHRYLRISCHLYNTREDIDRLCAAVARRL